MFIELRQKAKPQNRRGNQSKIHTVYPTCTPWAASVTARNNSTLLTWEMAKNLFEESNLFVLESMVPYWPTRWHSNKGDPRTGQFVELSGLGRSFLRLASGGFPDSALASFPSCRGSVASMPQSAGIDSLSQGSREAFMWNHTGRSSSLPSSKNNFRSKIVKINTPED